MHDPMHELPYGAALERLKLDDDARGPSVSRDDGVGEERLGRGPAGEIGPAVVEYVLSIGPSRCERARLERANENRRVEQTPGAPNVREPIDVALQAPDEIECAWLRRRFAESTILTSDGDHDVKAALELLEKGREVPHASVVWTEVGGIADLAPQLPDLAERETDDQTERCEDRPRMANARLGQGARESSDSKVHGRVPLRFRKRPSIDPYVASSGNY